MGASEPNANEHYDLGQFDNRKRRRRRWAWLLVGFAVFVVAVLVLVTVIPPFSNRAPYTADGEISIVDCFPRSLSCSLPLEPVNLVVTEDPTGGPGLVVRAHAAYDVKDEFLLKGTLIGSGGALLGVEIIIEQYETPDQAARRSSGPFPTPTWGIVDPDFKWSVGGGPRDLPTSSNRFAIDAGRRSRSGIVTFSGRVISWAAGKYRIQVFVVGTGDYANSEEGQAHGRDARARIMRLWPRGCERPTTLGLPQPSKVPEQRHPLVLPTQAVCVMLHTTKSPFAGFKKRLALTGIHTCTPLAWVP